MDSVFEVLPQTACLANVPLPSPSPGQLWACKTQTEEKFSVGEE